MGYSVAPLDDRVAGLWNDFVERSNEGTIFHRLDFLAYHGQRFRGQEHPLAILKGESLFAVMPLGVFRDDAGGPLAKSPYGASYGGPVFEEPPNYATCREVVRALLDYLRGQGLGRLVMTLPIAPYYRHYCETFRLALLEEGFACTNRDISSVVRLAGERDAEQLATSRARNMARKAAKSGVVVTRNAPLEAFWQVMEATFRKHGTRPTHTLEEFRWLHEQFPQRVWADVGYIEQVPVAGVGYFRINERVNCSFYLCQDPEYQASQAQSLLVLNALEDSRQAGCAWFDFGTSSAGMHGGENIFRFKESFGAVGRFRETYTWRQAGV